MQRFDVAIFGADAASAWLSEFLSNKGFSVILLDERHEIGVPVSMSESVGSTFMRLMGDMPAERLNLHKVGEVRVRICGANDPLIFHSGSSPDSMMVASLDQDKLDKEVAAKAALSGVDIRIRSSLVSARRSGSGYEISYRHGSRTESEMADLLVAARPMAGLPGVQDRYTYLTRTIDITRAARKSHEWAEISICNEGNDGYSWAVPKQPGIANVGVSSGSRLTAARRDLILFNRVEMHYASDLDVISSGFLFTGLLLGLQDPIFTTEIDTSLNCASYLGKAIVSEFDSGIADVATRYEGSIRNSMLQQVRRGRVVFELLSRAPSEKDILESLEGRIFGSANTDELWRLIGSQQ